MLLKNNLVTLSSKIKLKNRYFIFVVLFYCKAFAQQIITPTHNPALKFTENNGQWESNILFKAILDGGNLFLEKDKLTFNFYDKKTYRKFHTGGAKSDKDLKLKGHAVQVSFLNCNSSAIIQKNTAGTDYENFFLGNDSKRWTVNVKNYAEIIYKNLYENINYQVLSSINGIKYNFIVAKGGNPNKIKLQYLGADKIKLDQGDLHIKLSFEEITEKKPYAYQIVEGQVREVPCKYALNKNIISFVFPQGYNPDYDLIIDPTLIFAAQSGSTADNFGMTATFDMSGNLISGGTVFNNGYPTTIGAYDISFNSIVGPGNTDVVITKYNSAGTNLIFSTYLGGNGSEIVTSLICDAQDNLYLYGATESSNFPMAGTPYDATFNGGVYLSFVFNGTTFNNGTDIYIAKFNSTATALLASTYIGGSNNDGVNHTNTIAPYSTPFGTVTEYPPDSLMFNYGDQYRGEIQLDKNNNVYIYSSSRSANFPTTANAFDKTLGGKQDAVLCVFNNNLSNLIFSSFVGGSNNDCGNSLEVTDSLFVYATGGTCSNDFPITAGAHSTTYNGGKTDGYIVKIDPFAGTLLRGTYIGTSNYDQSYFVRRDPLNKIYVYGQSLGNMPVVGTVYSNPGRHQFITVLDQQLSTISLSTVFGSSLSKTDISPSAFAIDGCGYIYLSGWGGNIIFLTPTGGMPLAAPTQSSTDGYNFYLMGLKPNLSGIIFGSYFGGPISHEHVDGGTSRFDKCGNIYQSVCAGCGGNQDFPVTPGTWPGTPGNPNHSSNCNNGVFKLSYQNPTATNTSTTGCTPLTVQFFNSCVNSYQYQWNLGNGVVTSTSLNPIATYTNPGTYTVTLVINDSIFCKSKDSVTILVHAHPPITGLINYTLNCSDTAYFHASYTTLDTLQFIKWNFLPTTYTSNILNPVFIPPSAGTYTACLVVKNSYGCKDSVTKVFTFYPFNPNVSANDTICVGKTITLSASGGNVYQWQPATGLSNPSSASTTAQPSVTTIYSVTITNNTITPACIKTLTTQVVVHNTPTANFSYSTNPCGGNAYFTNLSSTDVTQWDWSFGNGQVSNQTSPIVFYNNGGTYTVNLIVSNIYGCKDTISKSLSISQPVNVSVNASTVICLGNSYTLQASGGFAYYWSPSQSLNSYTIANPVATPSANTNYTVDISTINSIGDTCYYSLFTSVNISTLSAASPSALAIPDTIQKGQTAQLVAVISPGYNVQWYPPGAVSPNNNYTVSTAPTATTIYTVVITDGICAKTATVKIVVIDNDCLESDVFVPNTFTPNGDGSNDVLYVRGYKIQELYFAVYNRWGELVFETTDKTQGWDGIYKGKAADVGVFGYYLKVKCINGKEIFKKGNVTLIR